MRSKILHLADDYGQVDILLVSKYLDRKITTFIKDATKYNIANNCYTNSHRKVKYISDLSALELLQFDTLLLTSSKSIENIGSKELSKFELVVVMNEVYPIAKIIETGFKTKNEYKNIVFLKKYIK